MSASKSHSTQDAVDRARRLLAVEDGHLEYDPLVIEDAQALVNLYEQLEVAVHRCTFPECVEGEKPERCGRCGDALALQSVTNELVRMKEQLETLREALEWCNDHRDSERFHSVAESALNKASSPAKEPSDA